MAPRPIGNLANGTHWHSRTVRRAPFRDVVVVGEPDESRKIGFSGDVEQFARRFKSDSVSSTQYGYQLLFFLKI